MVYGIGIAVAVVLTEMILELRNPTTPHTHSCTEYDHHTKGAPNNKNTNSPLLKANEVVGARREMLFIMEA